MSYDTVYMASNGGMNKDKKLKSNTSLIRTAIKNKPKEAC